MFFGLVLAAVAALPQPCTSATLDCTEWIKPLGQPSRILIYRTHPFETRNEHVTHAFVFVHGILRLATNLVPERLALKQFHGDKWPPINLVYLMDHADVRVIERGGHLGLPLKAAECLRIVGKFVG